MVCHNWYRAITLPFSYELGNTSYRVTGPDD